MAAARKPRRHAHCIDAALVDRAELTLRLLQRRGLTVVTAESCTAGLVAAVLSQAEGAADMLHGGFVTYTKENKAKALGVPLSLLRRRGAVNAEVAARLAQGALRHSPADVALAITGVLGPTPDEDGNPVGLVYLACCRRGGKCVVRRHRYARAPHDVLRRRVVLDALLLLRGRARTVRAGAATAAARR